MASTGLMDALWQGFCASHTPDMPDALPGSRDSSVKPVIVIWNTTILRVIRLSGAARRDLGILMQLGVTTFATASRGPWQRY